MSLVTSDLLRQFAWLDHGFGTIAEPLSQDGMVSLKQVHSNLVVVAPPVEGVAGEADALVTNSAARPISIRTADCLPILLVDSRERAVAAVHAGWRGTAAGIVREVLDRMQREYGSTPNDVFAAIGPGIGRCCYQVGTDVAQNFAPESKILPPDADGKVRLDLSLENRRQLIAMGVSGEHVDVIELCTFCNPQQFHSYRRDGERAGRMISFIGLTD